MTKPHTWHWGSELFLNKHTLGVWKSCGRRRFEKGRGEFDLVFEKGKGSVNMVLGS
jgi:hypothetical protein